MMREEIKEIFKQAKEETKKVDWGSKDRFVEVDDFNEFFQRNSPRWLKSRYDWEKVAVWIGLTILCLISWYYIIKGVIWMISQML